MALRIYDTLSRTKKEFTPVRPGKVGMYVCGMTVQGPPHVGHLRAAVVADMARRYLDHLGYEVILVHNFTDVDDKIIARSQEEGTDYWTIANRNIEAYLEAIRAINVESPSVLPRASEHMQEIIDLIGSLVERGYAYATAGGDVHFEVQRFDGYGRLSGRRVDELLAGARIEVDAEKRHPEDFALWKAAKPGEPAWPSPWGEGRPGWHIECSAMAMRYCGETVDLHGGGMDLVFPHHENELAQSEAATGRRFVNHWIQHGLVNLTGQKMSKSTDHFFLASDVFAAVDPLVVRYYLTTTHYRSPIEFSEERLAEAGTAVGKLWSFVGAAAGDGDGAAGWVDELVVGARRRFRAAMDDDFNSARALAGIFELVREVHRRQSEEGGDPDRVPAPAAAAVRELLGILGVPCKEEEPDEFPAEALELVRARDEARAAKDWARADAIRDQLRAMGLVVVDRPAGSILKRL